MTAPERKKRLRLLSFNLHGGRSRDGQRDLGRVQELMEKYHVDIGIFQEMETRPSYGGQATDVLTLAGPTRPYILSGPTMREGEGWYGNLLISRYPITETFSHPLGAAENMEPRNAVDAVIATPWGNLRVIGTHLSLRLHQRRREVDYLLSLIAGATREEEGKMPVLFMGDINEWQPFSALLRRIGQYMHPVPCGRTFPSAYPLLRLDRVWYADCLSMDIGAQALNGPDITILSDHLPVLIEIGGWRV